MGKNKIMKADEILGKIREDFQNLNEKQLEDFFDKFIKDETFSFIKYYNNFI